MENHKKWWLVVNPAAGNGKGRLQWPAIRQQLDQLGFEYEFGLTHGPDDATRLTRQAIQRGFRKIIAVGGDGTGHEVINGIFTQKTCPTDQITFTMIPVGTGNDWIKTHHIPAKTAEWLPRLKNGHTTFQDIGIVWFEKDGRTQKRYFFNVAGMAYDGFIGKVLAERTGKITNRFLYLAAIVKWLFRYTPQPVRVRFNGHIVQHFFYTINVGICRHSGGGMLFVPHADPAAGQLALTLVRQVPKWLVPLLTPFFYNGKIHILPFVSLHKARQIEVEATNDIPCELEADGEYLGHTPVRFDIIPRGLKIAVP